MQQSPTRNKKIKQAYGKMGSSTASALIKKIESKRAGGYDDPTFDLILPFARSILQSSGRKAARDATILRSFCVPFEDALVNCKPQQFQPGRINRQSITSIWNWVGSQLIPERINKLTAQINQTIEDEDLPSLRATCSLLYQDAADAIQKAFARAQKNEKAKQRLLVRIGYMTGINDAMEIQSALRHAKTIGELRERLPAQTSRLEGDQLENLTSLMLEFFKRLPEEKGIVTASFLARLKNPTQILHIPVKVLGSTNAGPIAASEFGVLGDILLFDIDCVADKVISQLRQNMPSGDILEKLEEFHERINDFNKEIDVSMRSSWGKRLARSRTRISDLLEQEFRQVPDLMREYVKNHGDRKIEFLPPVSDRTGVNETTLTHTEKKLVHALKLMRGCKKYMDQLSINNAMYKVENQIRQIKDFARIVGKSKVLIELGEMTE